MEVLDKTIEKALSFICIVQNSCDMHRQVLEISYKNHYTEFVKNSKSQCLEENNENKTNGTVQDVDVQEQIQELEIEELSQADKLLKKARRMREKYQMQSLETNKSEPKKAQNRKSWIIETQSVESSVEITSSTSEPVIHTSSNEERTKLLSSESRSVSSTNCIERRSNLPRLKTYQSNAKASYISRKDYNNYRTIPIYVGHKTEDKSNSPLKKNSAIKSATRTCGVSTNTKKSYKEIKSSYAAPVPEQKPSNKDFQWILEKKAWEEKVHKPKLLCLIWYPFLNSNNENRLALHMAYCDVKELRHISKLLHNIQETLYWLDLICLLGKEIAVIRQGNDNSNQQYTLVYNSLKSIFRKDMQRTPVLLSLEPC